MSIDLNKERLLLIDEDDAFLSSLDTIVGRSHLVVGKARTGVEALSLMDCCAPTMLISDLDLSELEGLSLLRFMRRLYPAIPVLVMTNLEPLYYLARCIRMGAKGYIIKSCGLEEVLPAIQSIVSGRVYVSYGLTALEATGLSYSDRELVALRLLSQGNGCVAIASALMISVHEADKICSMLCANYTHDAGSDRLCDE